MMRPCLIEQKEQRIARTNELMQEQQQPNSIETLALLPQLNLSDLSSKIDFHTVVPTEMFGRQVLVSELTTNHISYIDVGFDVSCLPTDLLPWLDLFGTIVTEIGTKRLNYQQFAKEIATCTGSFSHSLTSYTKRAGPREDPADFLAPPEVSARLSRTSPATAGRDLFLRLL